MPYQTKQWRSTLLIALGCTVLVIPPTAFAWDAPVPVSDQTHGTSAWAEFLSIHVNASGLVDYAAAKNDPNLLALVAHLSKTDAEKLTDSNERAAFWINAYNALAIYGVTLRLPDDKQGQDAFSVIDQPIDGLAPSKGFFEGIRFLVGGQRLSLDDIERKILLRQWGGLDDNERHLFEQLAPNQADPRIHFALVCCAVGCPKLQREAFASDRLDEQLDRATSEFFTDEKRSKFDQSNKKWEVSELIQWYQADFVNPEYANSQDSLLTFAALRVQDSRLARSLRTDPWSVSYLKYDWRLNIWRK
jgi:hypothetical protein